MLRYTIPLVPITKKNSQRILTAGNGRKFIAPSAAYSKYEKRAQYFLTPRPTEPITGPVNVRCLFYLPTRRNTDLTNLLEAIDDVMVKAGVLADDNYKVLAGHDGSRCYWDKANPRTEVYIEPMPEDSSLSL